MINLKQCTIHGSTILLGKGTSPRERFANDGPVHVVMLDFGMVALWDDRDPDADAFVIPVPRLKEIRMEKSELFKLLTEQGRMPEVPTNGAAHPADKSVAAQIAQPSPPSPLQPHPGPPATTGVETPRTPGDRIPAVLKPGKA